MGVLVVGAGLMGAQIAAEYALGGHQVDVMARDVGRVSRSVDRAFAVVRTHGLVPEQALSAARTRVTSLPRSAPCTTDVQLIVESIAEDLRVKADVLGPLAQEHPAATIATNTSSLSVTALGDAIEAPDRTLGTHYWNPPLLMPLVEVVVGDETEGGRLERVEGTLRAIGKTPVRVHDVPGFVWNRLQFALLREAVALVEQGVADARTVDTIVRDGLARRWRYTGPFQTAALGGAETFATVAANLFPVLNNAGSAPTLVEIARTASEQLDAVAAGRDAGLAAELRRERR